MKTNKNTFLNKLMIYPHVLFLDEPACSKYNFTYIKYFAKSNGEYNNE